VVIAVSSRLHDARPTEATRGPSRRAGPGLVGRLVGGFYLSMGGVHLGIVAADPGFYRGFADAALLPFVRTGWDDIFMAHPSAWGDGRR